MPPISYIPLSGLLVHIAQDIIYTIYMYCEHCQCTRQQLRTVGIDGLGSGCLSQSLHSFMQSMVCELLPEALQGESGSVHLFLPSGCRRRRCCCQCGSSSGRPPGPGLLRAAPGGGKWDVGDPGKGWEARGGRGEWRSGSQGGWLPSMLRYWKVPGRRRRLQSTGSEVRPGPGTPEEAVGG